MARFAMQMYLYKHAQTHVKFMNWVKHLSNLKPRNILQLTKTGGLVRNLLNAVSIDEGHSLYMLSLRFKATKLKLGETVLNII